MKFVLLRLSEAQEVLKDLGVWTPSLREGLETKAWISCVYVTHAYMLAVAYMYLSCTIFYVEPLYESKHYQVFNKKDVLIFF